jgi:hypothetical protein
MPMTTEEILAEIKALRERIERLGQPTNRGEYLEQRMAAQRLAHLENATKAKP